MPHLHETLKSGFSFSGLGQEEQAEIWDQVWRHSDCFEVMALALSWFAHRKQEGILLREWPRLKTWSRKIDNWAHADSLSGVYARILEHAPGSTYPVLQKWNLSKNPWERRLSLVSLLYYSGQRKRVLPLAKILALVEPQLEFDHHYVQKGVGWTLREAGNVYPEETYEFLEKNIRRLSAPAFSSATEKLSQARKERLKALRKGRSRT